MEITNGFFRTSCPICSSNRIHYSFIKNRQSVYNCEDCGFIFLNPQPSDEALKEIYKNDYFPKDKCGKDGESISAMKKYTARLYLGQLVDYYGQTAGKLLEIGCGNGDFIALAKETGFEVKRVEVSEHAAKIANTKLGVVCGDMESIDLLSGYFDICVLFDVIEHFRNPINLLLKIHNMLKPEGVLFIVTSSLDSWPARLMKNNWTGFKTEHLHYFDTQTIQNALAKTGYRDVSISPNYKCLTIDYIRKHFQKYSVPFFTRLVSASTFLLPENLKRRHFNVVASGINVLSRKSPLKAIPLVSIIVPVYNEKATFPELMKSLLVKELPGLAKEIVIVESNSTDGTREEVMQYKDRHGVKVVFEDRPMGKGHAVRTGLQHATGDFVMIQDGDLEYDLNDYDELLEPLIKHRKAFILGSRHSKGWKMRHFADEPLMSFVMNSGHIFFATLLNLFCWQNLKDPFTMYKVFRRDCLYGLTLKANRFDFDWELVIKLLRKGYRPLEIPVNYNSRSFKQGKKVSFIKDPLLWIWALFRFRFEPLYQKKIFNQPQTNTD